MITINEDLVHAYIALYTTLQNEIEKRPVYNDDKTRRKIKKLTEETLPNCFPNASEIKVKCDKENNTPEIIDNQYMAIDVEIVLKPDMQKCKLEYVIK